MLVCIVTDSCGKPKRIRTQYDIIVLMQGEFEPERTNDWTEIATFFNEDEEPEHDMVTRELVVFPNVLGKVLSLKVGDKEIDGERRLSHETQHPLPK